MEKFYFAPLEGISGYVYRKAYEHYFGGIDKYFIPFIKPNQKGKLSSREKNDILPMHNQGMCAVPQILTNSAEDFIKTAERLQEYGYEEVNLNLGCPSKTVVSKGRGSGFLAEPDRLNAFLEEIFNETPIRISDADWQGESGRMDPASGNLQSVSNGGIDHSPEDPD